METNSQSVLYSEGRPGGLRRYTSRVGGAVGFLDSCRVAGPRVLRTPVLLYSLLSGLVGGSFFFFFFFGLLGAVRRRNRTAIPSRDFKPFFVVKLPSLMWTLSSLCTPGKDTRGVPWSGGPGCSSGGGYNRERDVPDGRGRDP